MTLFPATEARLEAWRQDADVLGVVLVGSKSRGHADERSDDDLEVVLTGPAYARLAPAQCLELHLDDAEPPRLLYDAQLVDIAALQAKATSPIDLDRWPYERATVLFDRTGEVAGAVAAAAFMPEAFRAARLRHGATDAWLAAGRAEKTRARGYEAATRQLLARGAKALARIVFGLERRWVPLDHWLEAELATLADPAGAGPCLVRALVDAEPAALTEALERLQPQLDAFGFPAERLARRALFLTLVHSTNAPERAVHGLS